MLQIIYYDIVKIFFMTDYGKPLYDNLQYCKRCCMPETNEGIIFDEFGVCQACQSAEQKIHINWKERGEQLRKIFEDYKRTKNVLFKII